MFCYGIIGMTYVTEMLVDRPVMRTTFGVELEPGDIESLVSNAANLLDRIDYRVYSLVDATIVRLELADIMAGVMASARGSGALLHHPKFIQTIVVTQKPIIAMAARGLNVPTFGNLRVEVFPTMDEALSYIDAHIVLIASQQ